MAMSRCAILVKNATPADMLRVGLELGVMGANPSKLGLSENQSSIENGEFGVAVANEWGLLFSDSGPYLENVATDLLTELSDTNKIFFWLTQSTTAGLWFELHENGILRRKWVEVESQVIENFGTALPEEPENLFTSEHDQEGERDEFKLLQLAEQVTGLSDELLFTMAFEVYASGL